MVKLTFAKDVKTALNGARSVLVLAPQATFKEEIFPKLFSAKVRRMAIELAGEVKPGDFGANASTLTGGEPRKLITGVLPNTVSRYNSPARAEGIFKLVSAAAITRDQRAAIIVVLDDPSHLIAACNAIGRAFPLYSAKSDGDTKKEAKINVIAVDPDGAPIAADANVRELVQVAREAAQLVDTPPSDMNPEALAEAARTLFDGLDGVEITELVGDELLDAKLGGIHAVGRCAIKAPRLLAATYTPKKLAKGGEHVVLVGKGITFDTGGLHLKARGFMETMKSDMGGAAAVAGAFRVLAKSGIDRKLSVVMCIAENAIGPASYKPDDVLELHSGKTVEINNTDAEGRLLLADGVSWAARELGATHIFDAATLTGAQLIATGTMHAAVMSNDGDLEDLVVQAGYDSGDLVHPLPFAPELYRQEFKSPIADMRNSVKDRSNAQTSCAGQFIYNHIEDLKVKWAHIDLAGPAFRNDRGTGFGVALLSEAVHRLISGGAEEP